MEIRQNPVKEMKSIQTHYEKAKHGQLDINPLHVMTLWSPEQMLKANQAHQCSLKLINSPPLIVNLIK